NLKFASIRSDNVGEYENQEFESFCEEHDIDHNCLAPRTIQQNVVKRKNRSLEELARAMLNENVLPKNFCCKCFVLNNGEDHLSKFDAKAN
ncbi:hypothetical protein CR513_30159, partial [Mucuna pruriens]